MSYTVEVSGYCRDHFRWQSNPKDLVLRIQIENFCFEVNLDGFSMGPCESKQTLSE